ncbi:hypothetical protein KFZ70_09800 [Tamlana fucoidanivorans]|uniref:hypothetical protein n=1 Tax=Allotamlana fucoidanivorans TaxID=2583814 RepID=UPI0013050AF4|nr:hypothetical protein [Tamlana fucoidanivorans]
MQIPTVNPNYDEVLAEKQYENRKTNMLQRLEKELKHFLDKAFKPNEDWWNSSLTKD